VALKFHSKINTRPLKSFFLLSFCALLLGCLAACAQNLVTKQRQVKFISQKTEIAIGKKAKDEIVKEYGVYKDLDWQIYLDEVGQRVAKQSDRPELQYDFTIIDSDILNAFAVPGGFVFVTRGILMELRDEAELAIVLGHEITHIAAWHGLEMLQKAGLLGTLTAIGMIGGAALGAGEAAIALAQAAGIYENLYLVGYGRGNELQADQYGVLYAARAGYDPEAMLTFFQRLDKIEQEEMAGQHISPYWQDHPPTQERMKRVAKWIAQVEQQEKQPSLDYNRDKYLSMVARLPHGETAERGVIEGSTYKNVPFGITLEIPEGWKMDNSRSQTLVAFTGPAPGVRGVLERFPLSQETGVQEFAKQVGRQWGVQDVVARDVDYPAGHGLLWQYGGDYERFRTLLLVRGDSGYALMCQMTSEQYLTYLVDCEKIMRSLQIQ
jgi:predicted Zn-dependent protease